MTDTPGWPVVSVGGHEEFGRLEISQPYKDCRICNRQLVVSGPVIYCPACDHLQDMTSKNRERN